MARQFSVWSIDSKTRATLPLSRLQPMPLQGASSSPKRFVLGPLVQVGTHLQPKTYHCSGLISSPSFMIPIVSLPLVVFLVLFAAMVDLRRQVPPCPTEAVVHIKWSGVRKTKGIYFTSIHVDAVHFLLSSIPYSRRKPSCMYYTYLSVAFLSQIKLREHKWHSGTLNWWFVTHAASDLFLFYDVLLLAAEPALSKMDIVFFLWKRFICHEVLLLFLL